MTESAIRSQRRRRRWLRLYVAALGLMALGVALLPLIRLDTRNAMAWTVALGLMFWLGLSGAVLMGMRIDLARRRSAVFRQRCRQSSGIGMFHFFSNGPAASMDLCMFLSLAAFLLMERLLPDAPGRSVALALFVFSFGMHCMLNGNCYRYLKFRIRRENGNG